MSEEVKQAIMEFETAINFKTATVMPMEYSIDIENAKVLLKYIEQLQQENQKLKETLENNSKINIADHKYASEMEDKYLTEHKILIEFEKWLEEKEKDTKINPVMNGTIKGVLGKLQKLKEGKK